MKMKYAALNENSVVGGTYVVHSLPLEIDDEIALALGHVWATDGMCSFRQLGGRTAVTWNYGWVAKWSKFTLPSGARIACYWNHWSIQVMFVCLEYNDPVTNRLIVTVLHRSDGVSLRVEETPGPNKQCIVSRDRRPQLEIDPLTLAITEVNVGA